MEKRTVKEEIEEIKKQRQRTIYIPKGREAEYVEMRRTLGNGMGAKLLDLYLESKEK